MCNQYEPVLSQDVLDEFTALSEMQFTLPTTPFKAHLGPRDDGPFITRDGVMVGQWGMIRPNSPERVQRAKPKKEGRLGAILSTNNARAERMATAPTYRDAWKNGQRCLIPAQSYQEPYWGTGANIWWRFWRADGDPWMLAGLWSLWTDKASGEVVPNYTIITQNCDDHLLLRLMHRPELDADGNALPPEKQDKRAVVPIERVDWDLWLTGSLDDALSLIQLPPMHIIKHGAADPRKQVALAVTN